MYERYVLVHPDMGVFVGCALGLAFWSKLDCVGQSHVPVCRTEQEAAELRAELNQNDASIHKVTSFDTDCISFLELESQGYTAYILPTWREEHEKYKV